MKEDKFKLWQDLKKEESFKLALELGELVWNIVNKWDWFIKKSLGNQYTRSADSVAANISEGWGRYSFKDKYNYFRIARGSFLETMTWTAKAQKRGLIKDDDFKKIQKIFEKLPFELNKLMSRNKRIQEEWKE